MALVTLEQVKRHLRIDYDDEDDAILEKTEHASAIVKDYLDRDDLTWAEASNGSPVTVSDAPFEVQAAVLMLLTTLWDTRDGGDVEYGQADGYLPKPVTALLHRWARLSYA